MMKLCPHCQSQRIVTKDIAKKTCGYIGLVGGAASGTTGMLSGAEIGGTVGLLAGPAGGALGGIAGAKLGETIDDKILDNHLCLDCGYQFSVRTD